MPEKIEKYAKGSKGRDIIDSVVEENSYLNPGLYEEVKNNPGYYGQVDIGSEQMKLATVRSKSNAAKIRLIEDIVVSSENLSLDPTQAWVRVLSDRVDVHNTHPKIIAFIKACLACSCTPSEEYSKAVSEFVRQILPKVDNICLPIAVDSIGKIGDVVVEELNAYLKDLCCKNGIPFKETFTATAVSTGIGYMLKEAEGK